MISLNKSCPIELKNSILEYLKSKGRIRACLLYKLEKRLCKPNSKERIKKASLISCLFSMVRKRIIDIIIFEPFQIKWEERNLRNLEYLKDGPYYIRKFTYLESSLFKKSERRGSYFIDSRIFDFDDDDKVINTFSKLSNLLKKIPELKYKTVIYYPKNSEPLNIYETFEGNYDLELIDFKSPSPPVGIFQKIEVNLEDQKSDLTIIQSYRINYMCLYITLIETIQKAIMEIQEDGDNLDRNKEMLKDLTRKFAYNCIMYVKSDWVEIREPNPYRWETFFKFFNLPFRIIKLDFRSIKFHGRTFESLSNFKYCIYIKKSDQNHIKYLKNLGYEEFSDYNLKKEVAIGLDLEIFIPCPTIEHFYFLYKYIFYYHLFLLFKHSFQYLLNTKQNIKFSDKEQMLYKVFLPVMESLFNIHDKNITNKLIFKYYTFNPDELEIIYNKFLLTNVKKIEKKMSDYFFFRFSKK